MNKEIDVFETAKCKNRPVMQKFEIGDFLFCESPTTSWICIVSKIENGKIHYHINYNLRAKLLRQNDWFLADYARRMATKEEKKELLNILNKENLFWFKVATT